MRHQQYTQDASISLARVQMLGEALMLKEGLQALNLPSVAQATGYSVEKLSKCFPTASELQGAILARHATALLENIADAQSGCNDSLEQVRIGFLCKLIYAEEHPVAVKLFYARSRLLHESPVECLPEPARSMWKAHEQEELESIQLAQQQKRVQCTLPASSIQQLMRALAEWSFDDVEFANRCTRSRSAVVMGLLHSLIGASESIPPHALTQHAVSE